MHVEWYTANPGYHEIPVGYGLPWNTPEEEFIPDSLVYESQMALARAQMATQAPDCHADCQTLPAPPQLPADLGNLGDQDPFEARQVTPAELTEELPAGTLEPTPAGSGSRSDVRIAPSETIVTGESFDATRPLPPNWPDENCFVPGSASHAASMRPTLRPCAQAHKHLSRDKSRRYAIAEKLCVLSGRRAFRRLEVLSAAQRRFFAILLSHAYLRNAVFAWRESQNTSGVAVA